MKFLKYILLMAMLHGYPSCSMAQTTNKQLEFNSAWGVDYESNMVKNPSAAKNLSDTLKLGATLSRDTSAGNKIDGKASFLLDAGALNDYLELDLYAPSDEQTSGNCGFKGLFKGDARLYRAQILDGSSNILAQTVPLTNETGFRGFRVWYPCGASGARKVRITQTEAGTAPAINVGKFYYGRMEPGAGTSPNTFTAQMSISGVVSNEGPDFIQGNCTNPTTGNYVCPFLTGLFSVAPNCTANTAITTGVGQSVVTKTTTTSSVEFSIYQDGTGQQNKALSISCSRGGSDYVQPAITPDQTDYDWKDYSQAVVADSGTFPTYTLNLMQHAKIGGKLYLKGKITMTGTNTWNDIRIPVPTGLQIITSVITSTEVQYLDLGSNLFAGSIISMNTSYIRIGSKSGTNGAGVSVNQASPFTWASGDTIEWFIGPMDVVGWNNVQSTPLLLNTVYADTAIKAEKAAGVTSVDYGTYSATATNVTNATSITSPIPCSYFRIGSKVDVTCRTSTGCTTASGTNTKLDITLPIATTQTTTIIGTLGAAISGESGRVLDNGSNLARMDFFCQTTSPVTRPIDFTYQVP